jgi:hypothetical protein
MKNNYDKYVLVCVIYNITITIPFLHIKKYKKEKKEEEEVIQYTIIRIFLSFYIQKSNQISFEYFLVFVIVLNISLIFSFCVFPNNMMN